MSAQHTPGRWWVSGADDDEVHCRIFAQDMGCDMHIALVKPPCVGGIIPAEQLKANARLIAAAPDLLEALKQVAMWLPIMTEIAGLNAEETQVELSEFADDPNRSPESISIASSLEKARAAIAKAIG